MQTRIAVKNKEPFLYQTEAPMFCLQIHISCQEKFMTLEGVTNRTLNIAEFLYNSWNRHVGIQTSRIMLYSTELYHKILSKHQSHANVED
jgi:hypothetical protein